MQPSRQEDQILTCAARRSLDVAASANLRQLLQGDPDWNHMLSMAGRHRIVPSLHHHLARECADAVPAQVRSRLEQLNNENTRSNLLLTGELLKLLDVFAARGLGVVPFKGPTLALWAYGDVGGREFGDMDILVKKQDFPAVKTLLAAEGFTPRPELTETQQAAMLRFDCSHNFANEKNVWLDVHWDFVTPAASVQFDTKELWDRLEPILINHRELRTVSVEDLLLILCLHGFTHFWEKLGWICDVAALIECQRIDWTRVLENADRIGSRRILLLGLYLAKDLLAAPVPDQVWTSVTVDPKVKALADQVQRNLFHEQPQPLGMLNEVRLHLAIRERTRDKIKSCFRLLATPRVADWQLLSLPDSLFWLYYPLRPLRLAGKYARKLFKGPADPASSREGNEGVFS